MFSNEFNQRLDHLWDIIEWCVDNGGNPDKDIPDVVAEHEEMELYIQTEYF